MIDSFEGKYYFLSNFYYPAKVKLIKNLMPVETLYNSDLIFPTVEHGYVAHKNVAIDFAEKVASISGNKPGEAKKLGRTIRLRKDWDEIKVLVMEGLLEQKFSEEKLKKKLLDTGAEELVERNYWHDNFWGDCRCKKCETKHGINTLGKLLMFIREDLKQ